MNVGKTLFAQVMEFVPWKTFGRVIQRHNGDAGVRTLNCADLFRVMAFAQLTWRESLRDIEVCLAANRAKLFHMGLKYVPARSTLSDAQKWPRLFEQLSPIYKWTAGGLQTVQSCPRRRSVACDEPTDAVGNSGRTGIFILCSHGQRRAAAPSRPARACGPRDANAARSRVVPVDVVGNVGARNAHAVVGLAGTPART